MRTLLLAVVALAGCGTSLVSDSPDGSKRAAIVEHRGRFDRNFAVRIRDALGWTTIYESPDEGGRGAGAERFIWSKDGAWLLLVGKRFYSIEGVRLDTGEDLYLLYDVERGRLWCNAVAGRYRKPFGIEELATTDFGEEFVLRQ